MEVQRRAALDVDLLNSVGPCRSVILNVVRARLIMSESHRGPRSRRRWAFGHSCGGAKARTSTGERTQAGGVSDRTRTTAMGVGLVRGLGAVSPGFRDPWRAGAD